MKRKSPREASSRSLLRWLVFSSLGLAALALVVDGAVSAVRGSEWTAFLPLTVAAIGLALVASRPWIATVMIALAPAVATSLGIPPLTVWTVGVFAAFAVSCRGLPGIWAGFIIGPVSFVAIILYDDAGAVDPIGFTAIALTIASAAVGSALRNRRRYREELDARAAEQIEHHEVEVGRRVIEERMRIARDLHDAVGHEVAVLGIQLGVAEVSLPADAVATRDAIGAARSSVQSLLEETQRILHILRMNDDGAQMAPLPDYAALSPLVASFKEAGLDIEAEIDPVPTRISQETGAAVYRIVQESLTNAHRHGTGSAHLRVRVDDALITIRTSNAVRHATPPGRTGFGLVGMKERAESTGGSMESQTLNGEFEVTAVLKNVGKDA